MNVRYIPPVDTPCYSTYMGCYKVSPPPTSTVQNTMATNPYCPTRMCNCNSGPNCPCNMNHARAPNVRRYWVYKYNLY